MALIEGTHRGKPIYRVRWNYRTNPDGREAYDEKRFSKRADAMRFNREKSRGHTASTEKITVRELASLWFALHVDANLQKRTQKDYHCNYDKRIAPFLASRAVSRLTTLEVRQWRDKIAENVGARTVNKTLDALQAMIAWGNSEGLCINTMVGSVRRLPTPKPKPANPYTPEQVRQIAAGCKWLREATMIQVAAYAGLRWSELRALKWSDIDLDAGIIDLQRSIDVDSSEKATKSDTPRQVPILAPGLSALKAWRAHRDDDVDLVFPTSTGRPLKENGWYNRRLPKIREACGIHFDLHELRDTYASILIQSGVGEAELTKWLGHRSIQTTLDKYSQLYEKRKTSLVALANQSLAYL